MLIVGADSWLLTAIATKFQREGVNILRAYDGPSAIDLAGHCQLDLIVADYHIPQFSAVELCARLHDLPGGAAIRVLILTSEGFHIPAHEPLSHCINAVMEKPVSPHEVFACADGLLSDNLTVTSGPEVCLGIYMN